MHLFKTPVSVALKLIKYQNFERSLNESQKAAWRSFQKVVKNLLGNKKAENYEV
jgi:hypothetical protein